MTPAEAYPLTWPEGWPITADRKTAWQFKTTFDRARQRLFNELRILGAEDIILSTNLPLRRDGMPYASGVTKMAEPGVAVYFKYKDKDMVFACDKFLNIQDNINAVALTINAIRGIERWGASDMMERAFTGFKRLPEQASQPWLDVLELRALSHVDRVKVDDVEDAFRRLAKRYHPDMPQGDRDKFEAVQRAREDALREIRI